MVTGMQSYSVMRDGFPPFSHSHNHPFPSDPSPSSSSSSPAANAPPPPPSHLASQRSRIPAFAQSTALSARRSSTEPAAHALSRPDTSRPFPPSYSHEQNGSARTSDPTNMMTGPLPTTKRLIPAFGSSSSSSTADVPAPPFRRPSTSSATASDPSRHSPEADNECAAALSALAASAPSPSPAPSSQPLPSHLPLPDAPPLSAQSTLGSSTDFPLGPPESNGGRVALSPDSGEGSGSGVGEGDEGAKGGKGKKELKQTKRAAQNRAAQRAFRERKQQQIRDLESRASTIPLLESRITSLESRCHSYELERQAWDRERCALLGELETLRRVAGVERAGSVSVEGKRAREGEDERDGEKRVKVDEEFPRVEQVE
ncbi:transcription factor [Rhodotorula toruloides]|nr:transcription factor [Rhodotorula toruloides]